MNKPTRNQPEIKLETYLNLQGILAQLTCKFVHIASNEIDDDITPTKTPVMEDVFQSLGKNTRTTPLCLPVNIYKSARKPHQIGYDVTWELEDVLCKKIASKHFSQVVYFMESFTGPPDCQFHFVNKTEGLV